MPAPRAKAVVLKDAPAAAQAAWITPELIAETIRVWQPYYATELTAADAVEILLNVSRLVGALSGSNGSGE